MRGALVAALSTTITLQLQLPSQGQQPQWSPNRIPENSQARPISQAQPVQSQTIQSQSAQLQPGQLANAGGEQLGTGVTLRWKTVAPTVASEQAVAQATRLRQQVSQEVAMGNNASANYAANSPVNSALNYYAGNGVEATSNPLRSQVMQAAYQQAGSELPSPFGGNAGSAPPALPQSGSALPSLPGNMSPPSISPQNMAPQFDTSPFPQPDFAPPVAPPTERLNPPANDPLDNAELPPPPPNRDSTGRSPDSILESQRPSNPFPTPREDASPADRDSAPELVPPPSKAEDKADDSSSELKRRKDNTNSGYCDEMRSRIHANPISGISLDISPAYGAGFRAKKDTEQQRLDFASSAPIREWTDYRGYVVASGRMIDLRDGRVVIDTGGREQLIAMRDLSDIDTTYVGESWNIPERCGTGYDPLIGRDFVPATVQWSASGLCHKPLYFEQVQLERYGHEIGPVLQPIVSTAHFFGNIPLLPYKMGIHPPNECQYPLGYFRPGSCAPYMVQPIPWSLRGAAVQAATVTGAAALIP